MGKTLGSKRHQALVDLLTQKRQVAGLTQAELAVRLGEYQSFVARLESGQRRVDVVEFLDLAEKLGFDAARAINRLKKAQIDEQRIVVQLVVCSGQGMKLSGMEDMRQFARQIGFGGHAQHWERTLVTGIPVSAGCNSPARKKSTPFAQFELL